MNAASAPANAFLHGLGLILSALAHLTAARFRTLGPITVPLWQRIMRARSRLTRLIAHLAAGRLPRRDLRRGRPTHPSAPRDRLPTGHAWLIRALGSEAAALAGQLETLLADPATKALLAAAPKALRSLRPLCRMLGLALPEPEAPEAPSQAMAVPRTKRPKPRPHPTATHSLREA